MIEITPEQWKEIKQEYEAGIISARAIARKYGVRDKRIQDRAKKEGWLRIFASHSTKSKPKKLEKPLKIVDPTIEWPIRHLEQPKLPEQINPPLAKLPDSAFQGFHKAVKSIMDDIPKNPTDTPECGPEVPHPYQEQEAPGIYSERYEAIRLELLRRKNLAKNNRIDEDTLVKLIDRVGALDTEGAIDQLVIARMQVNADTLARTAELKAIRDRYMSLLCDLMGPDAGKAASAAMTVLASKNDSVQGAIKLIADIDKLITDAERKAFDMDKPLAKVPAKNKALEDKPFDISILTTEQLSALGELASMYDPQKQSRDLPLPPIEMEE